MTLRLTYYDTVDDLWKPMPVPEAPDRTMHAVASFLTRIIRDTYEGMRATALKHKEADTDKLSVYLEFPLHKANPRFCVVELEIGPQDRMHVYVDRDHQATVTLTSGIPQQDAVMEELTSILMTHIESCQTVELVMKIESTRHNVGLERSIVRNAWYRRCLRVRVSCQQR